MNDFILNDILAKLGASTQTLVASEQIILGPARGDGFDIDKLMEAWKAFEKARA